MNGKRAGGIVLMIASLVCAFGMVQVAGGWHGFDRAKAEQFLKGAAAPYLYAAVAMLASGATLTLSKNDEN